MQNYTLIHIDELLNIEKKSKPQKKGIPTLKIGQKPYAQPEYARGSNRVNYKNLPSTRKDNFRE